MTNFIFDEATGLLKRIAKATETVANAVNKTIQNNTTNQNIVNNINKSVNKIINRKTITIKESSNKLQDKKEDKQSEIKSKINSEKQQKLIEKKEDIKEIVKEVTKEATKTNNRLRDSRGRFIKKDGLSAKERAEEQKKSLNNDDDNSSFNIDINKDSIDSIAEATGGAYYKSFTELKDVFTSTYEVVKGGILGALNIKNLLFKKRDTTTELTASQERDKEREAKAEEEENDLLKDIARQNDGSWFSKILGWFPILGGIIKTVGGKLLSPLSKILPAITGLGIIFKDKIAEFFKKINPFPKTKPKADTTKNKSKDKSQTRQQRRKEDRKNNSKKTRSKAKAGAKATAKTTSKAGAKATAKAGAKIGVKAGAKVGAKIGARFIPFLGWALALWDAGNIAYDMAKNGTSLKSATSKQILGVDITEDRFKNNTLDTKRTAPTTVVKSDKELRSLVEKQQVLEKQKERKNIDTIKKEKKEQSRRVTRGVAPINKTENIASNSMLKEIKKQTVLLEQIVNKKETKTLNYSPQKEALKG